jgi:hypothetical protein
MLAYVSDNEVRAGLNHQKQNCWEIYLAEICGMLGAKATVLSLEDLEKPNGLAGIRTLIIGSQSGAKIGAKAASLLELWVRGGGVLIGFDVRGLDPVFGIKPSGHISQEPDDFAISGYFELRAHSLTQDIHPILFSEQRLLIISDIRLIQLDTAVELGRLYDPAGGEMSEPAVTWHEYGNGYAGYFAFDLAKTVWLLHQGRPIGQGSGNAASKTSLMSVVGNNSRKVPYADILAYLLQNMISIHPQPFIYQIPPNLDQIPDALLYWTGDEYYGPASLSLQASDFMKEKGLPYHINIASYHPSTGEGHPMSLSELQHIKSNGHEVSLWFYMRDKDDEFAITEERIRTQLDLFEQRFGYRPISTLMHATNWQGWAEPARWLAEHGSKSDNSFFGAGLHGDHPGFNSPRFAFGYGTSFPFYFYEDYKRGNEKIDLIEQPIVCYELGHRGSIGQNPQDKLTAALEDVHLPIDMAVKYHMTMNFFYHPVYIVQFPRCREAIEEIVRYIDYKQAPVLHMGNDQLCRWWNARTASGVQMNVAEEEDTSLSEARMSAGEIRLKSDCHYESGMIVKIALQETGVSEVWCGDRETVFRIKWEFGRSWLYLIVPYGQHQIVVKTVKPETHKNY